MEPSGGGCCFLYYAYGSNLLRERLLLSNPSVALCALARLQVRGGGGVGLPRVGTGGQWKSGRPGGAARGPGSAARSPVLLQAARALRPVTGAAVARFGEGGSRRP